MRPPGRRAIKHAENRIYGAERHDDGSLRFRARDKRSTQVHRAVVNKVAAAKMRSVFIPALRERAAVPGGCAVHAPRPRAARRFALSPPAPAAPFRIDYAMTAGRRRGKMQRRGLRNLGPAPSRPLGHAPGRQNWRHGPETHMACGAYYLQNRRETNKDWCRSASMGTINCRFSLLVPEGMSP